MNGVHIFFVFCFLGMSLFDVSSAVDSNIPSFSMVNLIAFLNIQFAALKNLTEASSTQNGAIVSSECCDTLVQTISTSYFGDGITTFTYDNNTCRQTANVTCSQGSGQNLYAGILINGVTYIDYGPEFIYTKATCVNGAWKMGSPAVVVNTLQCQLTGPSQNEETTSPKCCDLLVQTQSASYFVDGITTFAYDSDTCRQTVNVTCSQGSGQNMYAGIVVNRVNYVASGSQSVSFKATCVDGVWKTGNPALVVDTLQCQLTGSA